MILLSAANLASTGRRCSAITGPNANTWGRRPGNLHTRPRLPARHSLEPAPFSTIQPRPRSNNNVTVIIQIVMFWSSLYGPLAGAREKHSGYSQELPRDRVVRTPRLPGDSWPSTVCPLGVGVCPTERHGPLGLVSSQHGCQMRELRMYHCKQVGRLPCERCIAEGELFGSTRCTFVHTNDTRLHAERGGDKQATITAVQLSGSSI